MPIFNRKLQAVLSPFVKWPIFLLGLTFTNSYGYAFCVSNYYIDPHPEQIPEITQRCFQSIALNS